MGRLRIHIPSVMRVLSLWVAFLVVASSVGQLSTYLLGHAHLFGMVNLFSLDREANIPSWYSSVSLLFCAALLSMLGAVARAREDRWWRHWVGLCLIFVALAIDEAASIHELTIEPMRDLFGASGILYWAWVIPGGIFVIMVAAIYLRFILQLPDRTRRLFIISAVTFVGGALGMEMIGAAWFDVHGRRNLGYSFFWTVEETLEMCGVLIFIYALLNYLSNTVPKGFMVEFRSRDQTPGPKPLAESAT